MAGPLREQQVVGRYAIYDQIAAGGMAVVHIGRLLGQAGFARTVAIKRLHSQFAKDSEFVDMFLDEARLTARIQHPNVVAPLDVVTQDDQLLVVMEYVNGETFQQLIRSSKANAEGTNPAIICSIIRDVLYGLAAAHFAVSEDSVPLRIVHRDISPQNIMVGLDGVARVLDFGVAKATMRSHATKEGEIKGKISYMSPEQLMGRDVDSRTDLFATGVVLWEALTCRRLFRADDLALTMHQVLNSVVESTRMYNPAVSETLDKVVARALNRDPAKRFQTAREFAAALEAAVTLAPPGHVSDWVRRLGGAALARRVKKVAAIESSSRRRVSRISPAPQGGDVESPARASSANVESPARAGRVDVALAENGRHSFPSTRAVAHPIRDSRRLVPRAWAVVGICAFAAVALLVIGSMAVGSNTAPMSSLASASPAATVATDRDRPQQPTAVAASSSAAFSTSEASDAPDTAPSASSPATAKAPPPATAKSPPARPAGVSRPATRPSQPAVKKPSGASARCTPPFYLDDRGIRRIKPGCI
jgi:serine/threonine-protein kinase